MLHNARLYDRMGCDLLGLDLGMFFFFFFFCVFLCLVSPPPLHLSRFLGLVVVADSMVVVVRNWEFLQTAGPAAGLGGEVNPLRLLRRRESLVVADLPVSSQQQQQQQQQNVPAEMKSGGHLPKQQPAPTVFEEPDANSLLDSFGF